MVDACGSLLKPLRSTAAKLLEAIVNSTKVNSYFSTPESHRNQAAVQGILLYIEQGPDHQSPKKGSPRNTAKNLLSLFHQAETNNINKETSLQAAKLNRERRASKDKTEPTLLHKPATSAHQHIKSTENSRTLKPPKAP